MNEVEDLPQMMLQQVAKDVMLRINDVALRANGKFQAQKSLFCKDFCGFWGKNSRNYFVTITCESSGLEASTILQF